MLIAGIIVAVLAVFAAGWYAKGVLGAKAAADLTKVDTTIAAVKKAV